MPGYNHLEIEPKWQRYWEEQRTFCTPDLPQGPKLYVLDMFPYPSGEGLHVGHPEGYTATDIVCRFERMRGKAVLHPMGFDAFGLPAEEHAIKTNTPPRESTESNIATFRRQLKMLGFSYDWDRELATTDVEYFRWTQWIFLVLFDSWFDPEQQRSRPIPELAIPDSVGRQGESAVRRYQDEHRLAYQGNALVNWCPALGTVLANEEVQDGKSERGGHPVRRVPLRQWLLRITAYADRLEKDLDGVAWPESIKQMQREWIGRSLGAQVDFYIGDMSCYDLWRAERGASGFPVKPGDDVLRIYTTRPDTLYGATYMVIAPEHPFVPRLTTSDRQAAVDAYVARAASRSDRERQEGKEKTGVFTGSYAINPVNGRSVPIWISDYVLIDYGTGAIMAVPAHDVRDFEFAQQFHLPIIAVVDPGESSGVDRSAVLVGRQCFTDIGVATHSGPYDGLSTARFKRQIMADLTNAGLGREAVNYKLRDWLFSRQRFWGEPFPILHELDERSEPTGLLRAVDVQDLPVDLPQLEDYKPHGRPEPPLEKAADSWLYAEIDGRRYRRETNTMPQWAGSCWYYLRFIDPMNDGAFVDAEKERAWMPVDLYVGGAEHAVRHLLYARFWHKVLYDRGYVSTSEPFQQLINQGMILGEIEYTGYKRADGAWVTATRVTRSADGLWIAADGGSVLQESRLSADDVEKRDDEFVLKADPLIRVDSRAYKMSKSRGNVVNPDEIVREFGADSLRLYEMFMGPLEATKPWSMAGVTGQRSFLDRVWRMIVDATSETPRLNTAVQEIAPTDEQNRLLHRTIKEVTHDTERIQFNTAIARMMEFTRHFMKCDCRPKMAMEKLVLLLAPYAPHICEELWHILGHDDTLAYEPWPQYDEAAIVEETVEVAVQVSGKLRGRVRVPTDCASEQLEAAARANEGVASSLAGRDVLKVIVVPGRLVNFVTR